MATIGRITVPAITATGAFPFHSDYPAGMALGRTVITHGFADGVEQRFYVGSPATRYAFIRRTLSTAQRASLASFWQTQLGGVGAFSYDVPQEDGSFVATTVCFENADLKLEDLASVICSCGLTFVEIPDPSTAPVYSISATVTRFPDSTLGEALLQEVQEIIPLVHIRVIEAAVPDIYLSDRLVTVGGQVYLPRLLRVGQQGGDVLVEQKIDGSSDDVQFAFGNADRVMISLANDTELIGARVELSLFHVSTLRKLDLWAGDVVDWGSDTGPEFTVRCSDHLSALTLSSPVGSCSRTCYRRYGLDGCPATPGTQAMDTTHFATTADPTSCDLGYETDNGCLAHSGGANVTKYNYGAVWAKPQLVMIDDNSTGMMGIGRATITPTSQISDSIWGQTIPEIWHNDDGIPQRGLPVTCRIAAGRDESDFYIALGVVGKGPLGAFSTPTMVDEDGDGIKETFIGSTLDGQPHHGWSVDDNGNPTGTSLGLRQTLGTDPAGANDFFSLGRVGTTPTSWREVVGGASCYEDTYAAGVSLCEIRRTDQKGVQLTQLDSHSMIAMISQGLTGWVWDTSGTRSTLAACTNPVWVAINTYLRAIGLNDSDAATQAATFDVAAAVAAAATADEVVASLFGGTSVPNPSAPNTDTFNVGYDPQTEFTLSQAPIALPSVTVGGVSATVSQLPDASGAFTWDGASNLIEATSPVPGYSEVDITYVYAETYTTVMGTENQFRFKGTVDATKPTRDWLRDILNNSLGYFTWSFGALKIGCRNTAAPVTAFVAGNILFNSLHQDPFKPGFEKLTIDFADEEYQFQHNTVVFTDQDYAARHGRVANPRAAELGLVGSSTKSQAMRVAVCRAREELGGVGMTEQAQARTNSWRSTVLALDVEAGAVVSLADAELAGGIGTFRVQSWRLNRDWSVDLVGKTVRPSMYDLTAGVVAPTVTSPTPPPPAARDTGVPPTPTFAAQISPSNASALEIYDLAFPQAMNTLTIASATFTISFPGGAPDIVQCASFPPAFFSSSAASGWSLVLSLPGTTVTGVSGFVTNVFGNSAAFAVTVDLALSTVAMSSGSGATGDAAVFNSAGAVVDAGAPPVLVSRQITTTAPLTGGGDLTEDRTLAISAFTGDSGAGGAKGAVPAPGVGDAAAGKVLGAGGGWVVGSGGGVPTSREIHTTAPLTGGGDLTADRTLAISTLAGDSGAGGAAGAAPAPGVGDAAAGKFLKADATWAVPPGTGVPTSRQINTTAPLSGGGDLTANRTLAIATLAGDSGSGGAVGAVPAPGVGDAAAGKFLKADATWQVPPGSTIWVGTTDPSSSLGSNGDLYVETGGSGSGGGFISPLSAQGDIYGRTASADARIPVGTNGQLLTADSTQTLGVKWAAAPSGLPTAPSDATQFLNGAATPAFAQVKDTDLATTDVTGNNVGTTKHGFAPKAPNDVTKFLNGLGAWSAPSGGGGAAPFATQSVSLTSTDNHSSVSNTWEDCVGMTATFTPSSVTDAVAIAQLTLYPINTDWEMFSAQFVVDGVAQGQQGAYLMASAGNTTYEGHSLTLFCFLPALSAGSHTVKVQVSNDGSSLTYKVINRQMVVFPINAPAGPAGPTGPAPFQVFQSQAVLATSISVPNVAAGHFLAVLCNNSNTITGCSDASGNTYTKAVGGGPTDGTYGSLYISKITTGGTVVITMAGTSSYPSIAVMEFAATLAGTVDVSGTATTPTPVVLTTSAANEVIIAAIAFSHSANAATAGILPVVMAIGINTSDASALGGFFASIAGKYSCGFALNGTITDGVVLAMAIA